jgi:hypothetical protein
MKKREAAPADSSRHGPIKKQLGRRF